MTVFRNTCPDWCDAKHTSDWEDEHTGHTEHKTTIRHESGVSVDLVQLVEWNFDDDTNKWIVRTYQPKAVLGREFDNAESLAPQQLGARARAIDAAHRELYNLLRGWPKEDQEVAK